MLWITLCSLMSLLQTFVFLLVSAILLQVDHLKALLILKVLDFILYPLCNFAFH